MKTVVKIMVSEEVEYNLARIIELANSLQFFFRVDPSVVKIATPSTRYDDMAPTSEDLREFLVQEGKLGITYPQTHHVLLTDKLIGGPPKNVGHFVNPDLTIVSNYGNTGSANICILRLARWIVHAGMRALIQPPCPDLGCVRGGHQGFMCLCESCEQHLRRLGFRDSILHLKDSINWLNQRLTAADPSLDYHEDRHREAVLRLANLYADEIVAGGTRPFEGKIVLMVLHFLADLIPFVEVLSKLGARYEDMILVAKPYPYPKRDEITHALQLLGVNVHRASDALPVETCSHQVLSQLKSDISRSTKKIVVIEDGGYFAPLLHTAEFSSLLPRCVGIVEQTAKGAKIDKKQIPSPQVCVLSVAESEFKRRYEAPEIGRVTVQNISRFVPNVKLSGEHAVLFGFGSIGEHVAYHLNRSFNMGVSVVDSKKDLALMVAQQRKDIVTEAKRSFNELKFTSTGRVTLAVGTTGEQSISRDIMLKLPDDCILVSTSSDQIEIDVVALKEMSDGEPHEIEEGVQEYTIKSGDSRKRLILLAEGYPINFYGSESLPNDTIDPILTLLILCAAELCGSRREYKKEIDDKSVDEITQYHKLVERILR